MWMKLILLWKIYGAVEMLEGIFCHFEYPFLSQLWHLLSSSYLKQISPRFGSMPSAQSSGEDASLETGPPAVERKGGCGSGKFVGTGSAAQSNCLSMSRGFSEFINDHWDWESQNDDSANGGHRRHNFSSSGHRHQITIANCGHLN